MRNPFDNSPPPAPQPKAVAAKDRPMNAATVAKVVGQCIVDEVFPLKKRIEELERALDVQTADIERAISETTSAYLGDKT